MLAASRHWHQRQLGLTQSYTVKRVQAAGRPCGSLRTRRTRYSTEGRAGRTAGLGLDGKLPWTGSGPRDTERQLSVSYFIWSQVSIVTQNFGTKATLPLAPGPDRAAPCTPGNEPLAELHRGLSALNSAARAWTLTGSTPLRSARGRALFTQYQQNHFR